MVPQGLQEVMESLGDDRIILLDEILRAGHGRYSEIAPDLRLEHDPRAQASATYAHIVAEAERRFDGDPAVRFLDSRGLKLWLLEDVGVVVSFKKMTKSGVVQYHDSQQQKDFDSLRPLEGVPLPPVRLRVGYVLDDLSSEYVRTQIVLPKGKSIQWCAAIHSPEERTASAGIWYDVAEQTQLAV